MLRFTTCGSVDNGKSTLIGRMLHDSKAIFQNQYNDIREGNWQHENFNLAYLCDGLKKEREQGITIDVAYRYFSTPKRKFIIADAPGHSEFTRNMVTGSSNANASLVLIDARHGMNEQIKRHTIISSLLGIQHIIVCINKMDLVNFDRHVYEKICSEFSDFAARMRFSDVRFIPLSALNGDNVVNRSVNMPWYDGPSLMYMLDNIYVSGDRDLINCRFPVQLVIRNNDMTFCAGTVSGGVFKKDDEILVMPHSIKSRIKNIFSGNKEIDHAFPPQSVSLLLENDIPVSRGDMIVRPNNMPDSSVLTDAMICWFDESMPAEIGRKYKMQISCMEIPCMIEDIYYMIDVNTLHRIMNYGKICFNDIARVRIRTDKPVFTDPYSKNKRTGSFILIDAQSNYTVGAGMVR